MGGLLGKKKGPKPEEIYEAVKSNKKADVESLLAAKCDPNAFKDQFTGDACLHLAANKGRTEIIALLLSGGANVNLQNKLGQTALHCAAGYGALPIVKALVDGGADKSITDMDGNTPCELAKNYGQTDVVDML